MDRGDLLGALAILHIHCGLLAVTLTIDESSV